MNLFLQSDEFAAWLSGLADLRGKARIARRIEQAEAGNFGDCEPVGEGVSEMRIHYGPGYRAYFVGPAKCLKCLREGESGRI